MNGSTNSITFFFNLNTNVIFYIFLFHTLSLAAFNFYTMINILRRKKSLLSSYTVFHGITANLQAVHNYTDKNTLNAIRMET